MNEQEHAPVGQSRWPEIVSWIAIILFFLLSAAVRAYLSRNVQSFRFINDEMLYWNMAHSLWQQGRLLYHGVPTTFINLLYPLFLSPLTGISDVATAFIQSKVLGSLLISTAVFPAYLIARRLLHGRVWPLCIAAISLLVPEMIFSALMLTEVVFYPLALWFLYLVVRYLDLEEHRLRLKMLAGMAFFALLLLLCKTSSIFLPLSFGLLLIAEAWLDQDLRWEGLQRIGVYGGFFVIIYIVYNISFVLLNKLTTITATEIGVLVQYLNPLEHIPYIISTVLLYVLIFSLTAFLFPVLLPLVHIGEYQRKEQKLIIYALISLLVGSLIIVLTVTLKEDYPDLLPRIHLRYLFPLLFIWLPLGIIALERFTIRGREKVFWGGIALAALPYFYLVSSCSSLIEYDAPSRALLRWCKESPLGMESAYAGLRCLVVVAILLGGAAISKNKWRRGLIGVLLSSYAIFSVASGAVLQNLVAPELTTYQQKLVAEASAIGNFLSENPGNILLFCTEPRGDAMLEPYLPRPYYLLWEGERELHDYLWHEGNRADLSRDPLPVHVQYSAYNQRPHVAEINYIIISGTPHQTIYLEESLQLVELDTQTFKLYEVRDPGFLTPRKTLSGPLSGDTAYVAEHRLRQLAESSEMLLEIDLELQEDFPESGAVVRISHGNIAIPEDTEEEDTDRADPITVTIRTKRANVTQLLELPEEQDFFDLLIKVEDGEGNPLNYKVNRYGLRVLAPKS